VRIPKFVLPVLREQLASGGPIEHCALVIAGWSVYLEAVTDGGRAITITAIARVALVEAVAREADAPGSLLDLRSVFGDLGSNERFRAAYVTARENIKREGAAAAVEAVNARGGA
jgi:mannitol 2-dehydrogenase